MRPTLVILAVGLSPALVGAHTPNLKRLADGGAMRPMQVPIPAVTCTVQSTLLTGLAPAQHGIVANGWYFRDLAEVGFWKQSNHLVAGEKIWEAGRARNPVVRTSFSSFSVSFHVFDATPRFASASRNDRAVVRVTCASSSAFGFSARTNSATSRVRPLPR